MHKAPAKGVLGMIPTDNDPFLEPEAYYVNARSYRLTSNQEKGKGVLEDDDTPIVPKSPSSSSPNP